MPDSGELIDGRYRLVSCIGRGSMGAVWRARDERLDRVVALKLVVLRGLSPDDASEQEAVKRAQREGRITARLQHPNAISVHDVVEHDGRPCLVMEYLPSRSLSDVVETNGVLQPTEVATIGFQVASALAAAHELGIVHRDVKPDNILLADDGTAKITDFGIARAPDDGAVTAAGILAGTPAYLAPEVATGSDSSPRSDVFSLGSTLYAAFEGKPPHGMDQNTIALLHQVAYGEITPPKRAGAVADLLVEMLRRDPETRPTMAEVADRFEMVLAGSSPLPASLPQQATTGTRQMPALAEPVPVPAQRRGSPVGRWLGLAVPVTAAVVAVGLVVAQQFGMVHPVASAAPPTMKPSTSSVATPAPTTSSDAADPVSSSGACSAHYDVMNSWSTGYQAAVTITNLTGSQLTGWQVSWRLPGGQRVTSLWNGTFSQQGSVLVVRNASWNAVLAGNTSTSFGLVAGTPGTSPPQPKLTCTTLSQ
ncbi:protein kinase [Kutzneria buriramensis]|uniref:non-specific serine/threonine protein kinase n=1 Tax=Kutzneria buriramensis TaxID=1045776 RepID=A0A3E0HMJ0_9PSEU|nr:protein kinase [Kutzneria buriramensis]REH47235.1 serine/threonine protein kinase [Kutzneria buriramensis]